MRLMTSAKLVIGTKKPKLFCGYFSLSEFFSSFWPESIIFTSYNYILFYHYPLDPLVI